MDLWNYDNKKKAGLIFSAAFLRMVYDAAVYQK